MDLRDMRHEYVQQPFRRADLADEPEAQFRAWFAEAEAAGAPLANAMTLATVGEDGAPSTRVVLLKGVEDGALVFYTDYGSRKARELEAGGRVALNFHWSVLDRQVSVTGRAERHDRAAAEEYFRSRPRGSQLSALVSQQGQVVPDRAALEAEWAAREAEFAGGEVPLKDSWGGFRVHPDEWIFWQGREDRLHDRFRYQAADGGWRVDRLAP